MSSDSVERLQGLKDGVNKDIESTNERIAALDEKIERLEKASESLGKEIPSLKSTKSKIEEYEEDVSDRKWKGDEKQDFLGKYSAYRIFTGNYSSDASEAKEKIDRALDAAKKSKGDLGEKLGSLQTSLSGLDDDIEDAKED